MHVPKRVRSLGWLAFGALLAIPAGAQNLVANGGFNGALAPWTTFGDATYSTADAAGSPASGSAALHAVGGTIATIRQCVSVPAGTGFLALQLRERVTAKTLDGYYALGISFVPTPNCDSVQLGRRSVNSHFTTTHDWRGIARHFPVPPGTQSVAFDIALAINGPTGDIQANVDDVTLTPSRDLLFGDRFVVSADWKTGAGQSGQGVGVKLTDESGYFWFFDDANVELIVKVLNGCGLNNRYWVFAGGLTDVEVTLQVVDLLLGNEKTYVNPQGKPFQALQDTNALQSCP
jgi:hypothetical protein